MRIAPLVARVTATWCQVLALKVVLLQMVVPLEPLCTPKAMRLP
jgi:hypothetical protein